MKIRISPVSGFTQGYAETVLRAIGVREVFTLADETTEAAVTEVQLDQFTRRNASHRIEVISAFTVPAPVTEVVVTQQPVTEVVVTKTVVPNFPSNLTKKERKRLQRLSYSKNPAALQSDIDPNPVPIGYPVPKW